jgi:hypothetical protein
MEHRNDLADVLLRGLPAGEREQVLATISQVDADKLRRKREEGAEGGVVDAPDLDAEDVDYDDLPARPRVPPQG